MPAGPFSDEQVDAAVRRLSEPGRLDAAQRTVGVQAPALQGILDQALEDADWFGSAHRAEVRKAVATEDPDEREQLIGTLLAEETRVAMLIGVAVGLELANLLQNPQEDRG